MKGGGMKGGVTKFVVHELNLTGNVNINRVFSRHFIELNALQI